MASRVVAVKLVSDVGQYVSGMNTAAASTMRLGEAADTHSKKAQSGFDLTGKSALIMGGAVVGGLAMAISKSADFEKSMSAVQAATGASAGSLGNLRAAAMKAGADTQYSATEAANGITEMAKAGVSAKDILGGGLKGALSLAAAGQIDVANAAGIASVAMQQFLLTGKDLPHVADLLAAGAGKAMGSVDDLGQALNQSGLIASAAGLSIEETTGSLAAFANAGLIGSDAGTSLKTMLQALQAPSGKASELMSELGINMYDSQGNMLGASEMAGVLHDKLGGLTEEQRNSALATIFGSDAVRAANVFYKEGAGGIADWTRKVNDQGYAADQAAKLTDNLSGDLERLGGSLETLLITVGQGAQGPLRLLTQMLGGLVDGATWAVEAFGNLPGPMQAAIAAAAGWAIAGGKITEIFGSLRNSGVAKIFDDVSLRMMYAKENGEGLRGTISAIGTSAGNAAATGLKALASAIGPELAVAGVAYLATKVYEVVTAAGNARDEVSGMWAAVAESRGTEQVTALAGYVADLQQKMRTLRDEIPETKGAMQGFLGPIGMLESGGAIGELNVYEEALGRAKEAQGRASDSAQLLADKFHLTTGEVTELAGKYGIDLTGSLSESQRLFENFYTKDYGTTPTDAANATAGAMQSAKAQTEAAKKAQEEWMQNLQQIGAAFVDPLATYQALLQQKQDAEQASAQKTADSTASSTDSWKDYVGNVSVSLDEYATKLEEQNTNQENWRANLVKVAGWAGIEVAQILANMGAQGVDITAQMATGMSGESQRMADALIADAHLGGAGAAAELDTQMKVMAAVGAAGGKATADSIAQQLGIGAAEVSKIASQYGVNLATGVNPVLQALGKGRIRVGSGNTAGTFLEADGGVMDFYANGGMRENHVAQIAPAGAWRMWAEPETGGEAYIPLSPNKRGRSLNIWQETGKRLGVDVKAFAQGSIVDMGHRLQAMGGKVAEHPAFPPLDMHGHGKTSLHYTGHAIDVNTRPGTSAAEQAELAPMAALARRLGFRIIFMAPGHYNHLHVDDGGGGSMGSTGVMATVELPKPPSTAPYQTPISTAANAVMQHAYDQATAWVSENTIAPETGGSVGAPSGDVRAAVQSVAARYGWGSGAQWDSLSRLIQGESGWNPNAKNPVSSARGLFQKMTSIHGPIEPTVAGQAEWGLNYIKKGYGTPVNAYAKWSSRSPHWYSDGDITGPVYHEGTNYVPKTGWAYLEQGEAVVPAAANPSSREFSGGSSSGGGGGGSMTLDMKDIRIVGTLNVDGLESHLDGKIASGLAMVTQALT